jgi:ribonuclease P/MRP protein subunit POP7
MAVVKRVRKQLDRSLTRGPATNGLSLAQRVEALKRTDDSGSGAEAVVLGTGKAIEKCVAIASWFSNQKDCIVSTRTRTVGTVDDVVVDDDGNNDTATDESSRIRRLSALEVTVRLR